MSNGPQKINELRPALVELSTGPIGKFMGWTILELFLVMLIISILTAIGYGAYQRQVAISHRVEAKTSLMAYASRLESYRMRQMPHTYLKLDLPVTLSQHGYYQIRVKLLTQNEFILEASARGWQKAHDSVCAFFALDQLGNKSSTTELLEKNTGCW